MQHCNRYEDIQSADFIKKKNVDILSSTPTQIYEICKL